MPFVPQRHKPPRALRQPRSLVVALPAMHSNVNLSRIVRAAGSLGICRIITTGRPKVDPKVARDSLEVVQLEPHRSLAPVLARLRADGYQLVALEQASESQELFGFPFPRRTVLVVGHEREGVGTDILRMVDAVAEIPVYGRPAAYNAATATILAMYEYCRQFPEG